MSRDNSGSVLFQVKPLCSASLHTSQSMQPELLTTPIMFIHISHADSTGQDEAVLEENGVFWTVLAFVD